MYLVDEALYKMFCCGHFGTIKRFYTLGKRAFACLREDVYVGHRGGNMRVAEKKN